MKEELHIKKKISNALQLLLESTDKPEVSVVMAEIWLRTKLYFLHQGRIIVWNLK